MDKMWDRNTSKSEVIGRCGGNEKTEWPCRTDKSRKKNIKDSFYFSLTEILIFSRKKSTWSKILKSGSSNDNTSVTEHNFTTVWQHKCSGVVL